MKTVTDVEEVSALMFRKCLGLQSDDDMNSSFAKMIAQNLESSSPSMRVKKGSVLIVRDTGDIRVSTPRCVLTVFAHQEKENH